MRHTILGAGGSVGNALAYELLKSKEDVRLVSRSGYYIEGAEACIADLISLKETVRSVNNSDIVYLCVGLPYDSEIWTVNWPRIMKNVINACENVNAKLIFFDNVYMYGKVHGEMTETTPYNPCSRKGEVRARVALFLEDEINKKNIKAIIARAADLYGPYAKKSSIPYILAFSNLMNGKKAQWLIDANKFHSFTYTIDAARGIMLLSGREECYNQIWHLPTSNAIDGQTFIRIIANRLGTDPAYTVLNKWTLKLAGYFDKIIAESYEMLYQNESNYIFDSDKFNTFFNCSPTSYFDGIHETIEFLKREKVDARILV